MSAVLCDDKKGRFAGGGFGGGACRCFIGPGRQIAHNQMYACFTCSIIRTACKWLPPDGAAVSIVYSAKYGGDATQQWASSFDLYDLLHLTFLFVFSSNLRGI